LVIGTCTVDLHIPGCGSLKSKRFVLKSLKDRIRRKFNVSVAEVDHHDLWQRSTIAVAVVSGDSRFADQVISNVLNLIAAESKVQVIDIHTDLR
jgi:uncharacterized protein YlxP (DUF503 family)